ncbi:MAG: NAD(P)H-hydrate dehydratase [Actinomyces sp.]|uniref:bifunctional ADP-dependent NAD(P)H-hydrate dehydratase/NAD(P)H-hydrate epimerase n=1 Tax=Actinomyces sp. TaxID=29317 RepID=UPI0026DD78E8|nr:bifunctional ADP-dependent NAD(P)H-hydrate dehydratase/NAD(P)H-hydrate epimerase [Actinomyces sp.]MDO4242511.1 NAD(P)H-hydrate dehydratase [Actinomyces sp.]
MTGPVPTLDPCGAHRARAIAQAEAPLTAGTDRFMQAAAAALARAAVEELRGPARAGRWERPRPPVAGARVLVLAGGGHNGGDALLAGARLARCGCVVTAALVTDRPHPGALAEALAAGVRTAPAPLAAERSRAWAAGPGAGGTGALVIDGLTGIGASGPLRPAAVEVIAPLVAAGAPGRRPFGVLAVDLPSGTGPDDGSLAGPVLAADRTVTFTCLKGAHLLGPAARLCGRVDVVDLGLPVPAGAPLVRRPSDEELAAALTTPGAADHKYTRGVLGVRAGSQAYPGAAVLTCAAAVRVGAGMVRLEAPARAVDLVLASRPEVVAAAGRCQARVIGPGVEGSDTGCRTEVAQLLDSAGTAQPAVLDAGAFAPLAALVGEGRRCTERHVLVPHAGEAAALLTSLGRAVERGGVESDPAGAARELAALTGATVVLKGSPTLIATPGVQTLTSLDAGPAWLATAGSGDVLAGVLGAVLAGAQARAEHGGPALSPLTCAALAVRLHAVAGTIASGDGGGHPIAALDLVDHLPRAWVRLRSAGDRGSH